MHEKDIPGFHRIASNANEPAHALRVRRMSPQLEAEAFTNDLGDPATEPPGWSPLTGVSGKITAYLDRMAKAGEAIARAPVTVAEDILGTAYAAVTGQPPERPGPIFEAVTEATRAAVSRAPQAIQGYAGYAAPAEIAGYVTLPDGRRIPVAKSTDPYTAGEKARGDLQKSASKAPSYDAAYNRARIELEARKQSASQEQWNRAFALKERQIAQSLEMGDLQERAMELALERETSSPAQRALWGRPSTIAPEPPSHRTVKMIGPGVPGGIIERLY